MGKLTETFDFLNKKPGDLTPEYIESTYHFIDITPELWARRRELKLYRQTAKSKPKQIDLFTEQDFKCKRCFGTGEDPDTFDIMQDNPVTPCPDCNGTGER